MRGDFSRLRFERTKHYTSVLQQQGRVALDADSNEQCAIDDYLRNTETEDIVGPFGGQKDTAGFAITISSDVIQISPGRYYVHGILCENENQLSYSDQQYLINPALSDTEMLADLNGGAASAIRVYLEVWQRLVTALDDTCLREPALGQADTTARVQTVWRVVAELVPAAPPPFPFANIPPPRRLLLERRLNPARLGEGSAEIKSANCCAEMYQVPAQQELGKLSAQTSGGSSDCSCEPTPAAGYRGLENQLYRIEIHQNGNEQTATFKWSRENASVVVAITSISGSNVVVDGLGFDANLGFQVGQWVELSDDTYLFGPIANQPGELFQISNITPENLTLTMTTPVSGIDLTRNARLRRWDQFSSSATSNGIALAAQSWLNLEYGIQVQFSAGQYHSGDYWLIPARTASGELDWPPCRADCAAFQPPRRTEIYRAPLACIELDPNTQQPIPEDCRRLFPSLTELTPAAISPAMHVTKISWNNDDVTTTLDQLVSNGLQVTLDQSVTGSVNSGNFMVALEIPMSNPTDAIIFASGLSPIVLSNAMPLDGLVALNRSTLSWAIPFQREGVLFPEYRQALSALNDLLLAGTAYGTFTRVRVRLLGHALFGGSRANQLFLDGQCFGVPATRSDGATPRVDLQFPSGNLQKASDFESWFYLAPMLQIVSLTITPIAVTFSEAPPPPAPQATVVLNYAPLVDTTINLSVTPPTGFAASVSVPANVTIFKNTLQTSFDVTVSNTRVSNPQGFQIVASLPSALRFSSTQIAQLTVTGFEPVT
jgi:Family of unknown function (DUF6519)